MSAMREHCGKWGRPIPRAMTFILLFGLVKLFISPSTAKTHIRNIYAKLDVHSQRELTAKIDL